jgi:transposase
MGGKRPFALEVHRDWITTRLAEKPDLTLRSLEAELRARGAKASSFAVWSIVASAGLSLKKKPARQRARPARRRAPALPVEATSAQG